MDSEQRRRMEQDTQNGRKAVQGGRRDRHTGYVFSLRHHFWRHFRDSRCRSDSSLFLHRIPEAAEKKKKITCFY